MNRLEQKLRSRTGASISYGLFLFLICTILSSVILVAATSAAGRMSKMAEMDQRYYAVTSAAELLKELFDGKWASEVTVKDRDADPSVVGDKYYFENPTDSEIEACLSGTQAYSTDPTLLKLTAQNVPDSGSRPLDLTLESAGYSSLAVTIKGSVSSNGDVVFTLYNTKDSEGNEIPDNKAAGKRYTMELTFAAKALTATKQTPTKATTITTYTWNLTKIETPGMGS